MKTAPHLIGLASAFLAMPVMKAEDHVHAFLKIDGIPGESTNAKHKGEIDLATLKLGVLQSATSGAGGAGGAGKAIFNPVIIYKGIDSASPLLFLRCATGQHIPQAVLTLSENGREYFKVRLQDVVVSSCDVNSNNVENSDLPLESISLSYSKIEITYTPFAKGLPGTPITIGFDVKSNTSL